MGFLDYVAQFFTILSNYGANVLVAGSAVYKAADIPGRIRELRG